MRQLTFLLILTAITLQAQDYAPAAGQPGSTAIAADSPVFVSWATGVQVVRGYIDISDPQAEDNGSNFASFGEAENAVGPATNNVVSLGDAGVAILTFNDNIADGGGYDFAVFENSFSDTFLELAFVEVSSDGFNYFRFPSHSQTQTDTQVGSFGNSDPTYINNLAGKYRGLFGTPFDLSELADDVLLDKNNITHIKIIDVVGSINPQFASYDSMGNAINDPFNTPFLSGGFDLDAVGIINAAVLGTNENTELSVSVYPNPALDILYIKTKASCTIEIFDINGRKLISENLTSYNQENSDKSGINISTLQNGIYVLNISSEGKMSQHKFIKK